MQEQLKIQAVGQKQVLPLTSLSPTTLQVQWAKNSTYQIDFTAYDNGGADFAMLSAEASIYFGDDEFIIKSLQPSYQNGVSAKQVTATHVMSETSRIFVRDVKQGTITYLPKDVIDMFFKNNEYGFTYEIHGDFEKQQIENLGNCNGQDALSKIISTWEDAIIFPIGRKIHIYNEKAWVKNYQKRIDYIKDTNDVQLTVDSTGLANIVKVYGKQKDTDDSNKVEYYFDPFIVQDTASITSWGKHPMDDISDERFTDAKSMEKYARTQFVLEPIVSIQVTTNDNQKPTPGEQRYLIVHNNDFETFVTLEQYTWTPFNPNQGTQLIFDNMPVSILRTNANIAKRLSLASKQAKEAMDKAKNASNVFYSDTEPSSHKLGDTWYKKVSTDGNGQPLYSIKVWNGTTWVEVVNTEQWNKDWKAWNKHIEDEIIKAQNDFNSAWDKANNADNTATQALTSANAKTTNYYSGANGMAPVNPKNNDTWFKTEKDGHVSINVYDATTGKWINNDDYINRAHDEVKKLTETVPTKEQLSNSFEQATSEFSSQFNSIRLSTSEQNSQTYIETSQAIEDKANQINDVITANEAYNKSERDKLQASVRAEMSELSNADIALGSELDKASSEINSVRSETSANINHVKQSVSGAYNKISSLSDSLSLATSEIDSNYQSNSTSLSNLAKGLDSLSTGVKRTTDSLTATYNDQKGKVATLTTDVNGLKGAVKDNEDNINSLSLGAKGMSASISNAQGSINTLQADANGLKQEVTKKVDNTTYQTGISNLNNQIDLKANKSYVDGELSKKANSAELSVTNEQVKAQASRISSVTTTVNGVSSVANNALSKANNAQSTADSAVSKANNADSKIDNLSIGGRNLLKNSDLKRGKIDYNNADAYKYTTSEIYRYNGWDSLFTFAKYSDQVNEVKATFTSQVNNLGLCFKVDLSTLDLDSEYTMSAYMKANNTTNAMQLIITYGKNDGTYVWAGGSWLTPVIKANEWYRYTRTFKFDTGYDFVLLGFLKTGVSGDVFEMRNPQLEKGNKATDWSPAPEDVEGKITDLQNKTTPQQLIKTVTDISQANHVVTADSVNQSITGVRTEITKAKDELTGTLTTVNSKVTENTNNIKSTKDKTEHLISSLGADSNGNFSWANNQKIDTALGSYQTIKKIDGKIDGLQVGGRNLLKNSDFRNDNQTEFHKTWFNGSDINWDYSSETPFTSNERSLFITYKSTGNSTATGISYQTPIVLASPQEYTIGFWAKASVNGLKVQVESNGKRANFTLTTSWQYYSDVITFQSANRTLYMHNGGAVTGSWYLFHPQLEKGNKATDWSPAPEDVEGKINGVQNNLTSYKAEVSNTYAKASTTYTKADVDGIAKSVKEQSADEMRQEISKVSIGGTNLLTGTQDFSFNFGYNAVDSSQTGISDDGEGNKQVKFYKYNGSNTGIYFSKSLTVGQEYTLSFDARVYSTATGDETYIRYGYENLKTNTDYLSTDWKRYSVTFTVDTTRAFIIYSNTKHTVYIRKIQLEKGNKATDWSPSPEDVAYKSQVLQKNDSWVANIISNGGNLVSSINANTDGVRLQGKRITLDGSSYIANGVINNAMIANLDASKINAGSIDGQRLRGTVIDGNVANIKNLHATNLFADGLIDGKFLHITGASQLDNSIITNAKIADGAITTAKIGNGQISNALIANGAINSAKIANATIGTAQIADGAITNAKIGTIDAGKITTGTLNAGLIKTGSMSADRIVGGTLDMSKITAKNINASSITTGILGGANLSLNLMTGAVDFRHGHIQSTSGNFHIDIDNGTIEAFNGIGNGVGIHNGVFELTSRTLFDNNQKPYFKIDNYITSTTGAGSYNGASLQGRDALEIYVGDTEPSDLLTSSGYGILIDKTFGTRVIGGNTGVTLTAGTAYGDVVKSSPQIAIGAGNRGLTGGSEIHINASYTRITSATNRTTSSSPNLYVADDGTLLRSTSASKYKTAIVDAHGMENYGEKLINISPKLWVDKAEKARFKEGRNDGYVLHYGLIADELDKEGLSKLVRYDGDGEIEGIEYDKIAVALLPLLKKQQNQIAELQEQITELKGR